MPFSIVTKDGITINNIPDNIAPDSDILKQRVASLRAERDAGQPVTPPQEEGGIIESIASVVEPVAAIVSGAVAEPIAGIAGIVQAINPLAEPGAGPQAIESVREALTFQPRTEGGQQALQTVAGVIEPIAEVISEVEEGLGDAVFEKTGSPALAAMAKALPTLASELLGVAAARGGVKAAQRAKATSKARDITTNIKEAAPTIDQLKDTSRAIFKEIDDLGVRVKPKAFRRLVSKIATDARKEGLNKTITPKAQAAVNAFSEQVGKSPSLTELDTLRKIAQNAASSIDPADARLGVRMINQIDDFLDTAGPNALTKAKDGAPDVSGRYRAARDLWGRARKSEMLQESFEKARNQASGFENGIRVQFRQILNNKKKRKFFNKEEIKAMNRVVRGDTKENLAKLIGRLGFSEGGATNVLTSGAGIAGGAAVGGPVGAVMVPAIGQLSRGLAQRMTRGNAEFADQVIRAGKNGRAITEAYLENTPKAQRSAQELSELLMKQDVTFDRLPSDPIAAEAAKLALQRRAELVGATTLAGDTEDLGQ